MKKKHFIILTVLVIGFWCAYMGYLITYSEDISTSGQLTSTVVQSSPQMGDGLHISKVDSEGIPIENGMAVTLRYTPRAIFDRGMFLFLGLVLCIVMLWCCYKYFRQPISLQPLALFTLSSAICLPICLALFGWIAFRNMAIQCLANAAVFYASAYLYGRLLPAESTN